MVGLDRPNLPADREVALALKTILTTMVRPYQAALMECAELIQLNGDEMMSNLTDQMRQKPPPASVTR